MLLCLGISKATNDTGRLAVLAVWTIAVVLTLACSLALFAMPSAQWSILALLGLAGSSWGFWRYYRRIYESGPIDVVR